MFEHNQVSNAPTACPSGRIPWAAYAAAPHEQEGRMYTDAEIDAKVGAVLNALITLQNTVEAALINVDELRDDVRELTTNIQATFALAERVQDRINRAGIAE
jgi:hypothetical protein